MTTTRPVKECTFQTHDGVELFYRHWPSQTPARGAIVMFHRGHEHSGRMAHLAGLPAVSVRAAATSPLTSFLH